MKQRVRVVCGVRPKTRKQCASNNTAGNENKCMAQEQTKHGIVMAASALCAACRMATLEASKSITLMGITAMAIPPI